MYTTYMNILIIEDETIIREGIIDFLNAQGLHATGARDGVAGYTLFQNQPFDLVVLDVMMPKWNGWQVLEKIRAISNVPVIMLTALNDEASQIQGFDAQANDYVTKPFSLMVLYKRIMAALKNTEIDIWQYKNISVDFKGFSATVDHKQVDIKPKELKLLKYLLLHKGNVLTRQQMLDYIYDLEEAPLDRVIDVYIKNLRKKLHLDCIYTIKGVGYKIDV